MQVKVSTKLLVVRPGVGAAFPVARVAGETGSAVPFRAPVPRPAADGEGFALVPAGSEAAAPVLLALPYLAQHIAQEAMAPALPAPALAAAYQPAPPAAFEGLNFRTLA